MTTILKAGAGFDVGMDFARVNIDTPIELAPSEFAKPNCVVGYIAGNPASTLGFLRTERVRVHTLLSNILTIAD